MRGIGAVFGNRTTLWWDLPVIDSLELLQPMYQIPHGALSSPTWPSSADCSTWSPSSTRRCARSRWASACAPTCAPRCCTSRGLLFLDEPTIGLDVVAKEHIRQFILHVNRERGVTVLLTTHDLSDVERLCERVMILDHGQLLYDGTLGSLNERFESHWALKVDFERGPTPM